MFQDLEAVKIVGLFALFVLLVLVCIVVAVLDARKRKAEHAQLVKRQVEILKRAKAEAERRRQMEAQAAAVGIDGNGLKPSEFLVSPSQQVAGGNLSPDRSERQAHNFGTPSTA